MSKLLLLDGNSLLYRGFFAMRSLTTASGQPTNAVYSLTMMLLVALEREKPDAVVCAWDAPVATFRHEEFAEYKAQRAAPPEDLVRQRPLSRELMSAFNIPMLEVPGWEADDIIGTLAEREKAKGNEVLIVTGDLDAVQLVDDKRGPVHVMTTVRGVTETVVYDEAAVEARYGLTPAQIPDYKALKGDTSDNIPGLPGIGDKTATQLVAEFGSVEGVIASSGKIKSAKVRETVEANADLARQCKRLATIVRSIDLPADFAVSYDYKAVGPNREAAKDLFERLEFRTLVRRIPAAGQSQAPSEAPAKATAATKPRSAQGALDFDDDEASEAAAAEVASPTAVTLDESAWSSSAGLVIAMSPSPDKADLTSAVPSAIVIAKPDGIETVAWAEVLRLKAFLEDEAAPKIVHDSKLITGLLALEGIALRGVVFDTLLASYLLNAGRSAYRLADIARDRLGIELSDDDWGQLARCLRGLEPLLREQLKTDELTGLHDEIELPLSAIIARVELNGVAIDSEWMRGVSAKLADAISTTEKELYAICGEEFSVGSPKQLQAILFEKLKLPPGKKTKTGYSTDAEVLESLALQGFEAARKIVQWRELSKLKSQYADALPTLVSPRDGRIHTSLNQTVASTGRLSSTNPNLQNIPVRTVIGREIRRGFVASQERVLLAADYSQIELRIFAHITRDEELVRTFKSDEDIHRRTAAMVFGVGEVDVTPDQRRRAKTINFAVIYGMGEVRLSAELGVDRATAAEWRKRYFEAYPGVKAYADTVLAFAREHGYVKTLLGRRRYTPDIDSRVAQFRTAAEREAVNMPVQGTSADIIKLAMIRVDRALSASGLDAAMILQVHDELLFECAPQDQTALAKLVREAMESAYPLDGVPLKVDVKAGRNWADMAKLPRDAA